MTDELAKLTAMAAKNKGMIVPIIPLLPAALLKRSRYDPQQDNLSSS